jgi:hypothetical protein
MLAANALAFFGEPLPLTAHFPGGGGNQPDAMTTYAPSAPADVLKSRFVDRRGPMTTWRGLPALAGLRHSA